jgi:hypothetical protein
MQCNGLHKIIASAFVHLLHNFATFEALRDKATDVLSQTPRWQDPKIPVFMRM